MDVAPLHDNATPSGNGSAARLFAKLWHLTGNDAFRRVAESIVAAAGEPVARFPRAYASLHDTCRILSGSALLAHLDGNPSDSVYQEMKTALLHGTRTPDVLVVTEGSSAPDSLSKGFAGEHPVGGEPTAWICRGTECLAPVKTAVELREALQG